MIFGKFQLFLVLFGALLLKMETPFFLIDSSMRDGCIIIEQYGHIFNCLIISRLGGNYWYDIYISKKVEKEKMEIRKPRKINVNII